VRSPSNGATPPVASPDSNAILAALPPAARRHIGRHIEPITLQVGTIVYRAADSLTHFSVPASGLISLLAETEEGLSVEVGAVGREGVLGLPLLLGSAQQHVAMVQQGGALYRLRATA
jgi:hypothetical protein